MVELLKKIAARRDLLWILVMRNLKIRYKNSALGFFWSLLTPLVMILIYALFARILKFNEGQAWYLQMLVTGIVVWQFLSTCLNDSLSSVAGNTNLVKKTAFPRIILPLSTVTANLINFMLTLIVLVSYLIAAGLRPTHIWALPLVLLTHAALCMGLAMLISCANVFFRDMEHIVGVSTLAWFFLTPVFYEVGRQVSFMPQGLEWMIYLNPMTGIAGAYRYIFMSIPTSGPSDILISGVVCWAVLLAGVSVFQKAQRTFADVL
jgi:ABC-2 type transport system permease protein